MSLKQEVTDIGITGGLDTKTNPRRVAPPQVTTADNAILTTNGAVRKRNGFTALSPTVSGTGSLTTALAIQNVNGELVLVDGNNLYTYSPSLNEWQLRGDDTSPALLLQAYLNASATTTQTNSTTSFGNMVYADIGNYRMVAYDAGSWAANASTSGGIAANSQMNVGVIDKQKNTWLFSPSSNPSTGVVSGVQLGSELMPSLVAYGQYFYLFFMGTYNSGGLGQCVAAYRFDSTQFGSGFSFPNPILIGNTATGAGLFNNPGCYVDAQVNSTRVHFAFSYGQVGTTAQGPGSSVFGYVTTAGGNPIQLPSLTLPCRGRQTIATNDRYAALLANYGSVTATIVDLTSYSSAPTPVAVGLDPIYCNTAVGALGPSGTTSQIVVCAISGVDSGAQVAGFAFGTVTAPRNVAFSAAQLYPFNARSAPLSPISKPFYDVNHKSFVQWLSSEGQVSTSLQPSVALVDLTRGRVLARGAYEVGQIPNLNITNTTWAQPITTTFDIPLVANAVVNFASLGLTGKQIIPLDHGAFITGSRPTYYDGRTVNYAGYDSYPELTTSLSGTTGGSLTPNTPYQYAAIYRYYDNNGRLVLSSPSPFLTYTTASSPSQSVTFTGGLTGMTIPGYSQTNTGFFANYGSVILYRNTAADALDFREVGQFSAYPYTDSVSDATLSANGLAFLYAPPTNGELPNDPPPACNIAAATQQRIFVVSSENPTRLYFSKPFNPARAPEFNADSFLAVDPPTGPIVGLSTVDDKLIIFKANAVYQLSGDGPDADGNGAFNDVARISVDTGCVSQNSILSTHLGVFYQSTRGIQLLDRGMNVQYIGAAVEPLTQGQTVTASALLPTLSQVRFFLATGTVLVFDYLLQRWTTFSSANGYYAASATYWNGTQVAADNTNIKINAENTGFTDNGSPITLTLETPWLAYKDPQSWNRLRRVFVLGDFKSTTTATLSFAYDWNTTYIDAVSFSTGTTLTTVDPVLQWRTRAPRQVMQAVRLKLVDSNIIGESYDLTHFGLEYSVKSGTAKLPTRKSV